MSKILFLPRETTKITSSINSRVRLSKINHLGPGCSFYEIYEWYIFQQNTPVYIINIFIYFTSAERKVKYSRRSGMFQSCIRMSRSYFRMSRTSELLRDIFEFFASFHYSYLLFWLNINCKSILQKTLKKFGLVASKYERKSRYESNFQCVLLRRRVCLCPDMSRDVSPKCVSVWLFTVETLSFFPEI